MAIEATKTMMVGIVYSGASILTMFSIDSTMICRPATMMIDAITMVVIRSILTRC